MLKIVFPSIATSMQLLSMAKIIWNERGHMYGNKFSIYWAMEVYEMILNLLDNYVIYHPNTKNISPLSLSKGIDLCHFLG